LIFIPKAIRDINKILKKQNAPDKVQPLFEAKCVLPVKAILQKKLPLQMLLNLPKVYMHDVENIWAEER
jgi:hypothetical protein